MKLSQIFDYGCKKYAKLYKDLPLYTEQSFQLTFFQENPHKNNLLPWWLLWIICKMHCPTAALDVRALFAKIRSFKP